MTFQTSDRQKRSGFTLIELLLVVAIIAILSALGLSVLSGAEQDALESRTRAGIERISNQLNKKLEAAQYRILPVRLPVGSNPSDIRAFRYQSVPELLRVEFPFLTFHVNPTVTFPQNNSVPLNLVNLPRPQISARYWGKILNDEISPGAWLSSTTHVSAELLYVILSLNFDEFGQPLSAVLREREIGDTDGDGVNEVLDAFGDPLQFSLLVKLDETEIENMISIGPTEIVQDPLADVIGYEAILDQTQTLQPGQVRGPRPLEEYRLSIRSVNLFNTASDAVVTQ